MMDGTLKKELGAVASTIRQLSIEAVEKANSGHPGLPLGCAEIGAYLYGHVLRHNPRNPSWVNRDRFILSAGHGSMLLYSCLHLAKFNLPLSEIKRFRQFKSLTPGHPEYGDQDYGWTEGVEATTGPLGQGIANAVGQALGLKMLAARFNKTFKIFTAKVYCLAGDGCIMEGVSSEASSLAGHLGLSNLVLIYDSNKICLDGPLIECCSEDTKKRYEAYGWETHVVEDGNDLEQIHAVFETLKVSQTKPAIVILKTVIGKGSPNKQGTHEVHGAALGAKELQLTKEALGLPKEEFFIPRSVEDFFATRLEEGIELEEGWKEILLRFEESDRDQGKTEYETFMAMIDKIKPSNLEQLLRDLPIKTPLAGRAASKACLDLLARELPHLIGGSADLSGSDCTMMKEFPIIKPGDFSGRNIKFGVREFAMAAMATGLSQTHMFTPFVGTFFTFSDYMRNAIRLAAISKTQVIYQFTHDSVFLGEDGPTHQPVEHLASLRAMPNLYVIRPADNNEVKMAWMAALKRRDGPTAIILSRQALPELEGTNKTFAEGMSKGAYVVVKEDKALDYVILATGSEVSLAVDVADKLREFGKGVRVVSMPCFELFEKACDNNPDYRDEILGEPSQFHICIEAGTSFGWHKYIGRKGLAITIDEFGKSAPYSDLKEYFGFTVDGIIARIL